MSSSINNQHDLTLLSWKRLHLARAKLKASSRTSALLSGFAMVAMVELQITSTVPLGLLITFTACTTLLVSIHMLALMISTCILPNLEAVGSITSYENGLNIVQESPHEKLRFCIEMAWSFSTVFGIFLFLLELAILCWVKLYDIPSGNGKKAALVATIMLIPIGIIFIGFAVHFYQALISHKYERTERSYQELEYLVNQLSTIRGNSRNQDVHTNEVNNTGDNTLAGSTTILFNNVNTNAINYENTNPALSNEQISLNESKIIPKSILKPNDQQQQAQQVSSPTTSIENI